MSFDLRYATSLLAREACSVVWRSWPKSAAAILLGVAIAGVTLIWTVQAGCAGELQAGDDNARARRLIDDVVKLYTSNGRRDENRRIVGRSHALPHDHGAALE
jgi:hypothetical protein